MSNRLAQFLSYLLHPAIIPTLGSLLVLTTIPEHVTEQQIWYISAFVLLSTYFMPAIVSVVMRRLGIISSLHMKDPKDRKYPFLVSIAFFLITANRLSGEEVPEEIIRLLLASAGTILLFYALLRVTKLSVHLAGIGGLTAVAIYLSHNYQVMMLEVIALLILLSGLLGTARLTLRAHTPMQVWVGYACGFGFTYLALFF
ncbi:hypothetical protein [Phaeocystidibacter luteus]|uniref:Phosphatase PAP2 family protein n=1 Tax=Phaeocystidibacter luteus TaxID=911197 RepID=A0A6N6RGT0_9FLAO|nr:hypothetical protein [Phaeocystidibacter luteus]KAB2808685.1 hypothetical protein F8C67_10385 [Phaeocystidibacter luteus]